MIIELAYEKNTAYFSGFSSGRNIHLLQNISIQVTWRTTISLGRKPSILEAEVSCTLFPCENWVDFGISNAYFSGSSGGETFILCKTALLSEVKEDFLLEKNVC
jgi:hypothetical protein